MDHPTTRVLTVLELLQTHRRLTGAELAARREVAPRTVRRYVTLLQDMGIPIHTERGRYGAYLLRPGFKLPPLMFNDDEALAVTVGLATVRPLGLTAVAPAAAGALAKIERVLPAPLHERVRAAHAHVVFAFASPIGAPTTEALGTFSLAAQQRRRVWMRYTTWQREETERVIDPYDVVYRDGRWFVVGYCHLRADLRVFRLDRVARAQMREETFTPPPDFDSLAYVTRSLATVPGRWSIDVLLKTTMEDAQRQVPPTLATLDQEASGVVLRCFVQRLDWFAHVLVGLTCPLVIRRPPELREALRQLAAHAVRIADARGE